MREARVLIARQDLEAARARLLDAERLDPANAEAPPLRRQVERWLEQLKKAG